MTGTVLFPQLGVKDVSYEKLQSLPGLGIYHPFLKMSKM